MSPLAVRGVSRWTAAAVDRAAPRRTRLLQSAVTDAWARRWKNVNERFDVFAPGHPVTRPESAIALRLTLGPDTLARKVKALAAQTTQTAGLISAMGEDQYAAWVADEMFVAGEPAPLICENCWWDPQDARWHCRSSGSRLPA